MFKKNPISYLTPLLVAMSLTACGGSSSSSNSGSGSADDTKPNVVFGTRIDDTTGFIVTANLDKDTNINNSNGVDINPVKGIFSHNGFVYTVGSLAGNDIEKYSNNNGTLTRIAKTNMGENTKPGSFLFADDKTAYVNLLGSGEIAKINLDDLSVIKRIDLSSYALGDGDKNPEPSSGLIRDGKLYFGLAQIDSFTTFKCQGGASVVIIDVATDTVEKHLTDDRACMSGSMEPNGGLIIDEVGDIYVNNMGSYGYYPGLTSGYLRIKNGADSFDPEYFFDITNLNLPDVPGNKGAYVYRGLYHRDGIFYGNVFIPALTSNPPDYTKDKNYIAFQLDLRNKAVKKVDVPATTGWSAGVVIHDEKIWFSRDTTAGTGLFMFDPSSGTYIGDQEPRMKTQGAPTWIKNL